MSLYRRWFIISFRRRSFLKCLIFSISIFWSVYVIIKLISDVQIYTSTTLPVTNPTKKVVGNVLLDKKQKTDTQKYYSDGDLRKKIFEKKILKLSQLIKKTRSIYFNNNSITFPYRNVHIFYYAWYGNSNFDTDYHHWNHNYIPNWKKEDKIKIYRKHHEAPLDIGSNYYPFLGCYSSRDPDVIKVHMKQMNYAGTGVVVVSWIPPGMKDSPHDILPSLFYHANEQNIKVTLHIEPYFNRNPHNLRKHLMNFFDNYIDHPALYKVNVTNKKSLPLIYVYDSYITSSTVWKEMLSIKGNLSVRNTKYDAVFIGLLVDQQHRYHIKKSHFDGFYTYFASNSFTYGSTWKNWNSLAKFARQNKLIFIPSVGPGYIDTQVRPWNAVNTRHRRHGQYYDFAWRSAISTNVNYISVTSFNEWHEGTQIEPAQPKTITGFTYLDYNPESSNFYLNLTKWWVNNFFYSKQKYENTN